MMDVKKFQRGQDGGVREIEAVQLTPSNVDEVAAWSGGVKIIEHDAIDYDKTYVGMNIRTAMGVKRVQEYHWVCKDEDGQFYSLSEKSFNLLYNS